jgi:hypothetical protein
MRLYHFLPSIWAIEALKNSRVKVAKLDELNDPFELWAGGAGDRALRASLRSWKNDMALRFGMLCLSETWRNPLLWSHYADRHRGICLGFDVQDAFVKKVTYVNERIELHPPLSEETMQCLLFTKYAGWNYEQEWRCWVRLTDIDPNSGHYFFNFGPPLELREVIVGPMCEETESALGSYLKASDARIYITKARLAFRTFEIVKDQRGFE